MACFWNTLRATFARGMNNVDFVKHLKNNNKETRHIKWQGKPLTDKQICENMEHIRDYNLSEIPKGYLCSVADPFLFLIADVYNVTVIHIYNGHRIVYSNDKAKVCHVFKANKSHFWK